MYTAAHEQTHKKRPILYWRIIEKENPYTEKINGKISLETRRLKNWIVNLLLETGCISEIWLKNQMKKQSEKVFTMKVFSWN